MHVNKETPSQLFHYEMTLGTRDNVYLIENLDSENIHNILNTLQREQASLQRELQ